MEYFFTFPIELQKHTLTFLHPVDLDTLFELGNLQPSPPKHNDNYLRMQHLALEAKYFGKQIVLSNDEKLASIKFSELDYMLMHKVCICPSDITFALFDFTNYQRTLSFTKILFERYLSVLQLFTSKFNVRLILVENVPLENNLLKSVFQPLCCANLNVLFTIKYAPASAHGFKHLRSNEIELNVAEYLQFNSEIAVECLLLHLFDSNNLIKHLQVENGCFCCHGLKVLNLSYNNLTDYHLSTVEFPVGLQELNLSNNQLQNLNNSTFSFSKLTSLKNLNLSNNNIMHIELRDSPQHHEPYSLKSFNLSGNILASYSSLAECRFFQGVTKLDLSRNLLDTLTPVPPSVKTLDLTGNYLTYTPETVKGIFPSGLEVLKISCSVPTDESNEVLFLNATNTLIEEARLQLLKELHICGLAEFKFN